MSLVGGITGAFAQTQELELRRSDMSYPNSDFNFQVDTNVILDNSFQATGKNQRWDFSNLNNHGSFITKFLAPDANNGGDQIAGCNLVIQGSSANPEYTHMEVTDSVLRVLNNSTDTFATGPDFKPRALLFPLKYGMAWADSTRTAETYSGTDFGVPLDSIRVEVYILINNTCDGHGNLILPLDSVEALRVKQDLYYEYDVSGYSGITGWFPIQSASESELSYNFFNKDGGYYTAIVEYKADQVNIAEISYRSNNLLSVKDVEKAQAHVYPNPAQNFFQVEATQTGTMQIMDLQGKLLQSKIELTEGTNFIDIQALNAGQYLVILNYSDGSSAISRIIKK